MQRKPTSADQHAYGVLCPPTGVDDEEQAGAKDKPATADKSNKKAPRVLGGEPNPDSGNGTGYP